VETNIVIFRVKGLDAKKLIYKLAENGVKALSLDKERIRMVTHRGVSRSDIEHSLEVFRLVWNEFTK